MRHTHISLFQRLWESKAVDNIGRRNYFKLPFWCYGTTVASWYTQKGQEIHSQRCL